MTGITVAAFFHIYISASERRNAAGIRCGSASAAESADGDVMPGVGE